jgi:tRNA pseudouridine32 synthase / 23S rRNA pseudouridine746 synthase
MPILTPGTIAARVLHRDEDALVIDKPAGLPVHAGSGGGETLSDHLDDLRFGAERPELAHRLDKDTSGCLLLGRNRPALARYGRLFAEGRVTKTYWAVALGRIVAEAGTIDAPLARRSAEKRNWQMKVADDGDPSVTDWRVLGRADGLVWLELRPRTGRTHQLRVHLAHLGLPIAGDRIYGGDAALAAARRLHLHARALALPGGGRWKDIAASAPAPEHMLTLLQACGFPGEALRPAAGVAT